MDLNYPLEYSSAGSCGTSNNTITNCSIMEERKKITVNTDHGKSAVLVIDEKRDSGTVTATVKRGQFQEVE